MKPNPLTPAILLIALNLTTSLSAQVTIGSGQPPAAGALLELKQEGTTTKGLMLPRTTLINLTPTTDVELSASIGNTGNWDMTEHIGLIVYNVTKTGGICPGLYVWDGTNWVAIGGVSKPDITMSDSDGNVYDAKWFSADPCSSADGAYWITSNLYSTSDGSGNAFVGGARLNRGSFGSSTAITINSAADYTGNVSYGESATSITTTNQSPAMADFAKKFGLGYTYNQAMVACPSGWHLPTDADWNALILVHGGAAIAGAAMRANTNFYLANDYLNSHGWASNDASGTVLSGFNALPSGSVQSNGTSGVNFSGYSYWWSATMSGSFLILGYDSPNPNAYVGDGSFYFSVRCKKD